MAKDLPFTDTSMKMGILSVNDLLQIVITEKMVKNGRLSVKIQPFRTRFYGQMLRKEAFVRKSSSQWPKIYGQITEKGQFVRKMRFAYGQISQKWHFVRNLSEIFDKSVEQHCI